MKLTTSFVLALAAASSASASPLLRRQDQSSSSDALPTPSAAVSSASSALSSATSSSTSSATSSSSAAASTSTGSVNSTTTTFNDTQILQYALTLEHLEATFYNQSLSKLSAQDFEDAGYNASVRDRIYSIGRDEASHVELLTTALGNQSVPACTYNFSSVQDVSSFLTTARVLEGVGVSAYLGAAGNITEKEYLTVAGSILVVEGQHQSYLIAQTADGGNSIPSPYATPLDFQQVYSLAAPFIESCPENATLPITAFPQLTLSGGAANGSFTPGEQVTVNYNATNATQTNYLAVIQGVTGPQFLQLSGNGSSVTLPSNLTGGQMYAVVTSDNSAVTDDNTIAGPAVGYVNIPLPAAPSATAASSGASSSSSASGSSSSSASSSSSTSSSSSASASASDAASSSVSIASAIPTNAPDAQPTAALPSSVAPSSSA